MIFMNTFIIHHYPTKEVGTVSLFDINSQATVPLYELPVNQEDKYGPCSEVVSATLQTEDAIFLGVTDGTIVEIDKNGKKRGIYGPRQISRWDEEQKRKCKEPAVICSLTEHKGIIYDAGNAGFFETKTRVQIDNRNIGKILVMDEQLALYIYGPNTEKEAWLRQIIAEYNATNLEGKINQYLTDLSNENLTDLQQSIERSALLEYSGGLEIIRREILEGTCQVGPLNSLLLLAPSHASTKLYAEAQVGWLINAATKQQMLDVHGTCGTPHSLFFHEDEVYAFKKIREEGIVGWQLMIRELSTGKIKGLRYGPAVADYTVHEGEPYLLFANGAGDPLDRAKELVLVCGRDIEDDSKFLVVGKNATGTGMVSVDSKIVIGLYDREIDTTRFVAHSSPKEPMYEIKGRAYLSQ